MGNDQSKVEEELRKKQQRQIAHQQEVNRLLAEQQSANDAKLAKLEKLVRSSSAQQRPPEKSAEDVVQDARKMEEMFRRAISVQSPEQIPPLMSVPIQPVRSMSSGAYPGPAYPIAPQPVSFVNTSPPHNIYMGQLMQNQASTSQGNIYPNLDTRKSAAPSPHYNVGQSDNRQHGPAYYNPQTNNVRNYDLPSQSYVQSQPARNKPVYNAQSTTYSLNTSNGSGDFVFVDKNKNPQQSVLPQKAAQRVTPSAPPAPTAPTSKPSNQRRDRSESRSHPKKPNKSNADDKLNCPICKNRFGFTIFQCANGHSCCHDCKRRGAVCDACGYPFGDLRNRAVEDLVAETKASCRNAQDGCSLWIKLADMDAHLKECPYRDIECPLYAIFKQCTWKGKISQLASHFDDCHPQYREGSIDKELYLSNYRESSQVIHLVNLGPFNFLVYLKVNSKEKRINMTVQLLGTKHSASKWNYEIHLYNKREPRRKYQYTDVCHSNSIPLEEIFKESRCMSIPLEFAENYVNSNEGCLTYKFFVKRDGPEHEYQRGRGRGRGRGGRGRGATASS